jgi:hypothetical protein
MLKEEILKLINYYLEEELTRNEKQLLADVILEELRDNTRQKIADYLEASNEEITIK